MTTTHPFDDPERLRLLLVEIHYGGDRPWEQHPDVAELMALTTRRYAGLAAKHHREPADAAAAAWDVMRTRAARIAEDPWAVITHSVALHLFYEERAQGLLCGDDQVRSSDVIDFHDADRISERDTNLADFHPSFWTYDDLSEVEEPPQNTDDGQPDTEPTNGWVAVESAVRFFVESGWPQPAAQLALECIAARLIRVGNRRSAFESLRRDSSVRCQLDLDQESWIEVLHAVLGRDNPALQYTAGGRGILKRLLTGEHYNELFRPTDLSEAIAAVAPRETEHTNA